MSKMNAIIPIAVQINLDDVGWHDGTDLRYKGQASRSGIPRRHEPEDYLVLEKIGAALNTRIVCPLCLGDWDKDNYLRGEVGITHDPYGWNRAEEIDMPYARACFDALESSEHIEYAIHGLLHGRYREDGSLITEREYFDPIFGDDGKLKESRLDYADFKRRLSLFDKIYDSWGFSQKIRTFASPCGVGFAPVDDVKLAAEHLSSRGVRYWSNSGFTFDGKLAVFSDLVCIKGMGGLYGGRVIPWDAYDFDPTVLDHIYLEESHAASSIFCGHLTNFIKLDPSKNYDLVEPWVGYFKRESERLGFMLSRDIAFATNQRFYSLYARIEETDNAITVDTKDVTRHAPSYHERVFYISISNGNTPVSCEGGEIDVYEKKNDFITYRVAHKDDEVTLILK